MNTVDPKIVRRLEKTARVQGFLAQSQISALCVDDDQAELLAELFRRRGVTVNQTNVGIRQSEARRQSTGQGRFWDPTWVYLNSVGRVALLSREEEVAIAQRIDQVQQRILGILFHDIRVLREVVAVAKERRKRVSTGAMNRFLERIDFQRAPVPMAKRIRIFYMTQAAVAPPTFVLFTDRDIKLHFAFERFLENQIRDAFGFKGTPIWFKVKARKDSGQ